MHRKVPQKIGWGEGGNRIPELEQLLDTIASDLATVFSGASVNAAARKFRGSEETPVIASGEVTDSVTGDELVGATVTYTCADDSDLVFTTTTDEDGMYYVALWPGDYDVTVTRDDYMELTEAGVTVGSTGLENEDFTPVPVLTVLSTSHYGAQATTGNVIAITFDRNIKDVSGGTPLADAVTIEAETGTYTIASVAVSGDDLNITLNEASLENEDEVTVTVTAAGSVAGDADDALMTDDYVLTFTTVDALEVTETSPVEADTEVLESAVITLTFNRNIVDNTLGHETLAADVISVQNSVPAALAIDSVVISDNQLIITMDDPLTYDDTITVTLPHENSIICEAAGEQLAEAFVLTFVTRLEPLKVNSTVPADDAVGVSVGTTWAITFDRNIADNSGVGEIQDGIIVEDADNVIYTLTSAVISQAVLTVTVDGDLPNSKLITCVLSKDDTVKAVDNDQIMDDDLVITFTTEEEGGE